MIVILNNKCNLFADEFIKYQSKLATIDSEHKIVLCPSLPYLSKFHLDNIELGSQNVSSYYEGSYTGEVAATQLKDLGVKYCIVGHSERRKFQKETSQDINRKIDMLLDNDIIPILCVGENSNEKQAGLTIVKIINELKECLRDIENISNVIIAYEPIWAIGTGNTPTREEIDSVLKEIKEEYPENILVYGGSLSEKNIDEINKSTYIDGYLLGGLSLKTEELKSFITKI